MCDTLRTFQLVFLFCSLCHVFIVNALVQVTTEKFRETVENNKYVIVLFCKFYQFLPPVRYWGRKITHTRSIITLCNCEVEDVILFLMRCTKLKTFRENHLGCIIKLYHNTEKLNDTEKFIWLIKSRIVATSQRPL